MDVGKERELRLKRLLLAQIAEKINLLNTHLNY